MFLKKDFRKKCLAGILSTTIIFSLVAISGIAPKAQFEKAQDNLIVVLDLPKNISENDSIKVKNETVEFCKTCLESNDDLQISILDGRKNTKTSEFTKDYANLQEIVNLINPDGKENLVQVVYEADKAFKNANNSISKKMVIISDADSQTDTFTNKPEQNIQVQITTKEPHEEYLNYAEGIKNNAEALKQDNVDVYSVGVFLDDQNALKADAKQVLQDIQTKGYHEISNLTNLNQVFATISNDLTKNYPIIFIPGIMGSRLYEDSKCKNIVWAPEGSIFNSIKALFKIRDKMKINSTLYVKKPLDQNKVSIRNREYGATNVYKNMIDSLCERFPRREIYFFSYDFRQTNIENGKKLDDFINRLGKDKVDIVAHSMGGIILSNYIIEEGSSKINKAILHGSPLEGAPKLINEVMNLEIGGNFIKNSILNFFGLAKEVIASYPSTAELYPTKNYFDNTNFFVMSSLDLKTLEINYDKIDHNTYEKYGKIIFSDNYEKAVKEQERQNIEGINVLLSMDNVYFVFGTGTYTVKSVAFYDANNLEDIDTVEDSKIKDLIYETLGDGTVPYLSYTSIENVNKKVDTSHIAYFDKMNHNNIVGEFNASDKRSKDEKQEPINWSLDILEKGYSDKGQKKASQSKKFTVLKLDNNAEITVKKDGEILSSCSNDFSMRSDFGRLDLIGEENGSKILAIDDDTDYEITMNAKQAGDVDYSVRWYNEAEALTEERDFLDVPITENTKITTNIDKTVQTKLTIDVNGDGSVIQEIAPTSIIENEYKSTVGLSDISLSAGELSPKFKTETLNYEVLVDKTVSNIDVMPKTVGDSEVIISENGVLKSKAADGSSNIALKEGENKLQIIVKDENGNNIAYNLCISRGVPLAAGVQGDSAKLMSMQKSVADDNLVSYEDENESDQNVQNENVFLVVVAFIAIAAAGAAIMIFIKRKKAKN